MLFLKRFFFFKNDFSAKSSGLLELDLTKELSDEVILSIPDPPQQLSQPESLILLHYYFKNKNKFNNKMFML